jgi:predicted amidophosphoribosyltransferase
MPGDEREISEAETGVFTWPPRRVAEVRGEGPRAELPELDGPFEIDAESADANPARTTNATAQDGLLESVEHTWLDVVSPPLARRMKLLDWAPDLPEDYCHRCGATLDELGEHASTCEHCPARRIPWERLIRLGEYRYPLTRFIHDVKFTGWTGLGNDLGRLLGRAIRGEIDRSTGIGARRVSVIPVPTTFRRRMVRGIDHTAAIARGVARELDCEMVRALSRRHRPSQLSVATHERPANVAGTIRPRRTWGTRLRPAAGGDLWVVVDDVTTTRATVRAACLALRRLARAYTDHKPIIWTAVVAVTPAPPAP